MACGGTPPPAGSDEEVVGGPPTLHAKHVDDDAIAIDGELDAAWADAPAQAFDTQWSGAHTQTETTVRALWSEHALYMLWELSGMVENTDRSRPTTLERVSLFQENCVELFFAPNPAEKRRYFEIELGPRGHFFDLLIDRRDNTSDQAWSSVLEIKTDNSTPGHAVIEVALRNPELVSSLRAGAHLPIGMFRMEGKSPRQYLAWSPTLTPRPNFHVPDKFGFLSLE